MPGTVLLPPPVDPTPISILDIKGFKARVVNDGSFRYGIDDRGPARTVTYEVEDREAPYGQKGANFCDALMGLGKYSILPFGWPDPHRYPNNTALSCISANATPIGPLSPGPQLGEGTFVHVVADYLVHPLIIGADDPDAMLPDLANVPWASLQSRGGFEEITIPGETLQFGDQELVTKSTKKVIPHVDYVFRRSMIPNLFDYDQILCSLCGTVNDDVFMGKQRGTVRLQDWDQDYNWDASGKRVQEFSMVLRWRPIDWNWELRPGSAVDFEPVTDQDGHPSYAYADYTALTTYGVVGPVR